MTLIERRRKKYVLKNFRVIETQEKQSVKSETFSGQLLSCLSSANLSANLFANFTSATCNVNMNSLVNKNEISSCRSISACNYISIMIKKLNDLFSCRFVASCSTSNCILLVKMTKLHTNYRW